VEKDRQVRKLNKEDAIRIMFVCVYVSKLYRVDMAAAPKMPLSVVEPLAPPNVTSAGWQVTLCDPYRLDEKPW